MLWLLGLWKLPVKAQILWHRLSNPIFEDVLEKENNFVIAVEGRWKWEEERYLIAPNTLQNIA